MNTRVKSFFLFAALMTSMLSVEAQVYKCRQGGKTIFSDTPCDTATRGTMPAPRTAPRTARPAIAPQNQAPRPSGAGTNESENTKIKADIQRLSTELSDVNNTISQTQETLDTLHSKKTRLQKEFNQLLENRVNVTAPLATSLPTDLFQRTLNACESSDYPQFLGQFSVNIRAILAQFSPEGSAHQPTFFQGFCQNLRNYIATDLQGKPENHFYVIKKINDLPRLCVYAQSEDVSQCRSKMRVVVEGGQLRFDSRFY